MNNRTEFVLNQLEQWDKEQKTLVTQLMVNVSEKMVADIIITSEDQYPKLGLLLHPDQELYYKIPNPELYIEMYRRILGLDFGPDAQLYIFNVDPDEEGTPRPLVPIYIGITIFWPDESEGLSIGTGIIPEKDSIRMNLCHTIKAPEIMKNTFFTPYLARMIRDLNHYFESKAESQNTMMKLAMAIYRSEDQE